MRVYGDERYRAIYSFCGILVLAAGIAISGGSLSQAQTSQIKKPLIYQMGNVVHINADGERPLLVALQALREKYGWIVDYEDPQYLEGSGQGNPASLGSRRHPDNRRMGGFSVEFNVGTAPAGRPDENTVLTAVVNAFNQNNAMAQFELRNETAAGDEDGASKSNNQEKPRYDVIGSVVRSGDDGGKEQQFVLDAVIELAKEPRTLEQTIRKISEKVSSQSGVPVMVGAIATSGSTQLVVGGTEVTARKLLAQALAATGEDLSWLLIYDRNAKHYELSVTGSNATGP